jgi:tetratricopeptide (TPR) repeat protein
MRALQEPKPQCYIEPMTFDSHDNKLTTESAVAVGFFDAYVTQHLNYGPDLGVIFSAIKEDPDDPYLNAHGAVVHMGLEAAEGFRAAQPFLEKASLGFEGHSVSDRERRFIEAAFAFASRDLHRAADILSQTAAIYPTDISAAKWAQYHHFNLGQARSMLEVSETILPALEGRPFVHGMYAFALEQNARFEEAEEQGRKSIALCREDPWAHHAIAHVMEMKGRVKEGEAFMKTYADTWEAAGIFIREHNWWHIALFHLDQDAHSEALKIFDEHLWGEWPEFGQEQIGAVSSLWRMELRGIDVGARWSPVGAKIAEREFEHVQPFHDLHYIFALARSGREDLVSEFIHSMERHAETLIGPQKLIWAETCLPLARGIHAYARGDFDGAHDLIDPLIERLPLIGGSHAQRDLFVQSWIETLFKTQRYSAARDVLERRIKVRPDVKVTQRQLDRARLLAG